ncbi:MAG: hypothetical protein LQ348_001134 [Seirophora lacunosa]|nr:MAG: hypothetical protein LQ348_001134 [Seirophora lacunosa]
MEMDTVEIDTSNSASYGYIALVVIGAGLFLTAGFSIVPFLIRPHNINNAIGFMAVVKQHHLTPISLKQNTRET